jgi:SET domain-containing protein
MSKLPASNPYFIVRNSPIHGRGVFAACDIRKGTRITEYVGERISHAEADRRHEDKAEDDNHTFLFTVSSRTVIDGGNGGNDARWINHSCDPNCESVIERSRVFVEAVRNIKVGEELTYDYMIERDPDDPPGMDEVFGCRCGTAKCRGTMLVDWEKPKRKPAKKKAAVKKKATAKKKTAGKRAR